jgi:uncharacterized membrane protein
MSHSKLIAYLEVIFAVVVWGGTFIATKVALQEVSPATIVWLRFAMGLVILGIAVVARKQFAIPEKSEWLYFALLGFLGVTLHQWLQATGLQTAKATTTAWIVATTPVFIATMNSEFAFSIARSSLGSPEWCASNSTGTRVRKTAVAMHSLKRKFLFIMLLLLGKAWSVSALSIKSNADRIKLQQFIAETLAPPVLMAHPA